MQWPRPRKGRGQLFLRLQWIAVGEKEPFVAWPQIRASASLLNLPVDAYATETIVNEYPASLRGGRTGSAARSGSRA